eukprot:sb/3466319/
MTENERLQQSADNWNTSAQENINMMKREMEDLMREKQELEVKLDTKHSSMEELVARLDTAERERNEALVAMESQQSQIGQDLAAMGQELETTRQYLETMEGSKMESEEALQMTRDKLASTERELSEASERLETFEKTLRETGENLESTLSTEKSLRSQLRSQEEDIADLRAELVTVRQENGRLESHSNSVDRCLASLKEENQRLGESLANTEKTHSAKVATLHEEMSRKMEGLSQVGGLQNQIKMLESSLEQSKLETEGIQAKCTNTVTEYSSKLLASEKRCSGLREEMDTIRDAVRSRDQDIEQLKIQHDLALEKLRRDHITREEHDQAVFNLETAYEMNLQVS